MGYGIMSVYEALGWQGGTIHQVVAEIKAIRERNVEYESAIKIALDKLKSARKAGALSYEESYAIEVLEKAVKKAGEK